MRVEVLRLGHRYIRDKRLTTHVGLTARAFCAQKLIIDAGDEHLISSIDKISESWGGDFCVEIISEWKKYVRSFKGDIIHLTMYGINVDDRVEELRSAKDKLIIIGGAKVPPELYEMADYNIAVGNQPHSEASALAIVLDRIFMGKQFIHDFKGRKKIIGQEHGKNLIEKPSGRE